MFNSISVIKINFTSSCTRIIPLSLLLFSEIDNFANLKLLLIESDSVEWQQQHVISICFLIGYKAKCRPLFVID